MTTYKYNLFAKILYRYGNFPVTFFLLIYLIESIVQLQQHWYAIFFIIINSAIIILLNKYYLKTYGLFPFTISVDNEKMVCSNFFLKKSIVEIKHSEIDSITGGIFSGYPARPIYIHDAIHNTTIGVYVQTEGFKSLLKIILRNVPQNLYDELVGKMNIGMKS